MEELEFTSSSKPNFFEKYGICLIGWLETQKNGGVQQPKIWLKNSLMKRSYASAARCTNGVMEEVDRVPNTRLQTPILYVVNAKVTAENVGR